jgi:purine-binding chemotaxis protein CheW
VLSPAATSVGARLAGKYMAFKLGDEEYGLPILSIREIIGMMATTRIPRSAPFVRGVINLRGKVIVVIDLRLEFGMSPSAEGEQTVIIVVQYPHHDRVLTMGLLVDEVLEVLDIPASRIEPPPDYGSMPVDGSFIVGIGKSDKRVIFLLDEAKVLSVESAEAHAQIVAGAAGVKNVETAQEHR